MTIDQLPAYDRLRVMRETFEVGHRAAVLTSSAERAAWYAQGLANVQAAIDALRQPIGGAGCGADIKKLRRGYAAKQVTPREFGRRMQWLLRAR